MSLLDETSWTQKTLLSKVVGHYEAGPMSERKPVIKAAAEKKTNISGEAGIQGTVGDE